MSSLKKSIAILLPAMRISFAMVLLTTCILLSADFLGFTSNESSFILDARKKVSESLAIQFSIFSSNQDTENVKKLIRYIVKRNPDILSAGIRQNTKELSYKSGNHDELWGKFSGTKSTSTHVLIPIMKNKNVWATVELRFSDINNYSLSSFFHQPFYKLIAYVLLIGFFVYLAFMLRILRQLDPSAVIPDRVNNAFDTLSEGVIILDENEQIVLTNKAFSDKVGHSANSMLGIKVSELNWERISTQKSGTEFPWLNVIKNGKGTVGSQLLLKSTSGNTIKFVVNASPIGGDKDDAKGVLITLDDITELEERNSQLKSKVSDLKKSEAEIKQKNIELHYLATRDPMTSCLNRRSFSELFEKAFNEARDNKTELSCFMADLDHFKNVNDNYGHAMGDEVIKLLAEILHSNTRKIDLVARYGGEEFCVVLPGLSTDEAFSVAERIRLRMKDESIKRFDGGPRVTASIGVASIFDNPETPDALNNLADEALYSAKETGRNRVVIWKPLLETEKNIEEDKAVTENPEKTSESSEVISLQSRITELEGIATVFSAELEHNKSYDALTGLPNQILLYDRISQTLERGHRHDELAAVLIIDIGMFSQINATLGRSTGDLILQTVAQRLESIFRKGDNISRLTISRVASDEFAVLLTDLSEKEQVTWAVKRLLDELNIPVEIDENTVYLSCKVGISLYPSDANCVDDLLNNAMTAKQHCKTLKGDIDYQFYDNQMQTISINHLRLDKELRHAIENESWSLHYQPKFDIKQQKIIGVEALLRWNHPEKGLLSPFEFIDFAEQRGLIIPIGNWVIKQACKQIKEWMDHGIYDCTVAVNLSSVQLMHSDIVNTIINELETHKVPPRLLELEITETALMDNIKVAVTSLKKLNSRGIKIAIDDFGTGYSSLSYLKNLPIDTLKIDRSFIKDLCQDDNDQQIVQTLITMAHSMNLSVIAEGVEETEQFNLLNQYGCNEIQGYLLSKPIEADDLLKLLKEPKKLTSMLHEVKDIEFLPN